MRAIYGQGITTPFPSQTPEHMADALGIRPEDRVLDVGGGAAPLTRADVILDRDLKGGVDRDGIDAPVDGRWLAGDIHALPFADRTFDFVYCCHVLEHTQNPALACEELMRVAQRGYIETPRRLTEMLHGHPTHRWLVDVVDGVLVFERRMFIESPLRNVMLAKLLTDPEVFQAYLIEQRHLTCVQFAWSGRFDYKVIEPPGWQKAFDYDNPRHAGWSHYYFALNLLANQAPTGYVHSHIQQACALLPNEGLPAALACGEALLDSNLPVAKEMLSVARQLGCEDACLSEYETMLALPQAGSAVPLPTERDEMAANRNDGQIANLYRILAERDRQIANLYHVVDEKDLQLANLKDERDRQLAKLYQLVIERDSSIAELLSSTSWRITAPLRSMTSYARKLRSVIFALPKILHKGGGVWPTIRHALRVVRNEGILGVKIRLKRIITNQATIHGMKIASQSKLSVVPYYVNPKFDSIAMVLDTEVSVAVHLHLCSSEMVGEFVCYLNHTPVPYDLYVSVPENGDTEAIHIELNSLLAKAKNVVVESVPNRGRNIAALIIQFGERLSKYQIIAHLHSQKTQDNSNPVNGFKAGLNLLMGTNESGGRIAHIIGLLQTTAKIVFPEAPGQCLKDCSGWAGNYALANHFLEKHTRLSINDFPSVEFPETFMFWARTECLKDFLELPLNYSEFPTEPIPADGTLVHTLARLILVLASEKKGQCIRLHQGDSIPDYRYYEKQQDYSSTITHSDIKVMSYYLPQFHPIPENDLWHGKDFTEWTKVRAANPLFEGHYQQHIPHADIGYYLLDSPDILRRQAEMMHKSGVYGQVFYHYWFSGKLILEEPAKLLLDTPDIQMPFCFCWANENWTRSWDGNENEILLGQNYSAQDAHDFIHYLIPFFNDPRYIKVEDRPLLFVYRPSSIPNSQEYLAIWQRECAGVGIKPPYVTAVLTRGATHPKDFGMDAGVERVLHDWTLNAVPEINNSLHCYQPINGSVLPYDDVANFYMKQTGAKDFTYFRSLLPIWDNTARYGSKAYLLHESTPQRFQEWLESSIAYTQSTLPQDRRFVLVNAWNEWAEGAHLEPDSRFGYSYLNAVGRALSSIPYSGDLNPSCTLPAGTRVHLSFSEFVLEQLRQDHNLKERFIFCLSRSSIFDNCSISINAAELMNDLPTTVPTDQDDADFILELRHTALFDASVIEKIIQTSYVSGSAVIANSYNSNSPLVEVTANNSVHAFVGYTAPLLVLPKTSAASGFKNIKMRTDARCFAAYPSRQADIKKPVVTTIIRFHKTADFNELKNALYCLSAMSDCVVIPLIAAQDLSMQQIEALENTLLGFTWIQGCEPQIHLYQSQNSNGDLRSKMLNESLKKVKTRYAAFLDFDDLLMPHAYGWLINRLEQTGKAVSFGRVYATGYDSVTGLLLDRKHTFEYGYSYQEFVLCNHAPLHSIMLDLERLDLSRIVYFEDQRYMEDYLLTLQLFTEDNCDWDGLKENFYIGDYIHSIDRAHTLAFSDEKERQALLSSPEYMLCEQRICDMRNFISKKNQ